MKGEGEGQLGPPSKNELFPVTYLAFFNGMLFLVLSTSQGRSEALAS